MAETWIYMQHPDLENSLSKVTLEAFVGNHEKKGWEAVEDPQVLKAETPREAKSRVFKSIKKKKPAAKK